MAALDFIHRFLRGSSDLTLVLLHGTGGNENDLLGLGRLIDPTANVLSPRGKVIENGVPRFFRRLAMGVFDVDDLKARAHELADFVEAARQEYALTGPVIAVGYSNGANIAASQLLLRPETLDGAALLHGMVPFAPDTLPDLDRKRVLITGGERDPMVPAEQTRQLAAMLEEAGADMHLDLQPGGHELSEPEVTTVREWLTDMRAGKRA